MTQWQKEQHRRENGLKTIIISLLFLPILLVVKGFFRILNWL